MKNIAFSIVNAIMKVSFIPIFLFLTSLCSFAREVRGQEVLNKKLSLSVSRKELKSVLKDVSKLTGARFLYSAEIIRSDRKITIAVKDITLSDFLHQLLSPLQISFEIDKNGYIYLNSRAAAVAGQEGADVIPGGTAGLSSGEP